MDNSWRMELRDVMSDILDIWGTERTGVSLGAQDM